MRLRLVVPDGWIGANVLEQVGRYLLPEAEVVFVDQGSIERYEVIWRDATTAENRVATIRVVDRAAVLLGRCVPG